MKPLFTVKQFMSWILLVGFSIFPDLTLAQDNSTKDLSQFVEIDGYKYHVKVAGQEHIEKGIPVVVLESGFGSPLMTWDTIFNDIAKIAPILVYERPGVGQSEWNQMEYSPINIVQILRKILTKLELPPPYILAGHSWGGVLIRTYAGHFPDEVKALAYIESTDFTVTDSYSYKIALELGVDSLAIKKYIDEVFEFMLKSIPDNLLGCKVELKFIINTFTSNFEDVDLGSIPKIPIVVFVGTKYSEQDSIPGIENPIEKAGKSKESFKLSQKHRIESYSKWLYESPEGYLIVSSKADHYFHLSEPKLVIEMIKRLL